MYGNDLHIMNQKDKADRIDLPFKIIRTWISRWRNRVYTQNAEAEPLIKNAAKKNKFSPMTYRNPYMIYMHMIIERVISLKKISFKKLELVIIDAEEDRDQDDDDIQMVLYELEQRLNYLLLITDRPDRYESFMEEMYKENGLIVQKLPKSARRQARGNLILDFERSGGVLGKEAVDSKAVYLPVYKRPWEISENLDILVPVGYNTLVVDGIFPPDSEESSSINERFQKDKMIDRLDREFRKG